MAHQWHGQYSPGKGARIVTEPSPKVPSGTPITYRNKVRFLRVAVKAFWWSDLNLAFQSSILRIRRQLLAQLTFLPPDL